MGHLRLFGPKEVQHFIKRYVAVTERDVDLVQQHHVVALVADQFLRLGPGGGRGGDITLLVLRFPGKAFAHRMEIAQIGEMPAYEVPLAGIHAALDELDHGTGKAVRDAAEDHSEGGGGFALSLARMDDDQTLFTGLRGHDLVTGLFLARHLGVVTFRIGRRISVGRICHVVGSSLSLSSVARSDCTLLRRGVHRPRSIASVKRASMSAYASRFAV